MSYFRATTLCAIFIALLTFCLHVSADEVSDLSRKYKGHQSSLNTKQSALEVIQNRLASYKEKAFDATSKLRESEESLLEAKNNLSQSNSDTSENGPKLRQQYQQRLKLAERGVQAKKARMKRVLRKKADLEKEVKETLSSIAWLKKQINLLPQKIAQAKNKAETTKRLQESKNRIAQERAIQKKSSKEEIVQEKTATTELAILKPQVTTSKAVTVIALQESKQLSPQQRFARQQMKVLHEKTKSADKSEKRHYLELLLTIDRHKTVELEYLGSNHFYSEVKLKRGKHKLSINLRQFVASVPASEDGDTYVVIYDATNKHNGKFVIFNKNLLI